MTGDPNHAAIERAALDVANAGWLAQVAELVAPRLDSVRSDWRDLPDRDALRAAVFGLLLGLLSARYHSSREALSRVAEAHPSFQTFPTGRKLPTLEKLASSEQLATEWIGPLLGVDDPHRLRPLCAFGDDSAHEQPRGA